MKKRRRKIIHYTCDYVCEKFYFCLNYTKDQYIAEIKKRYGIDPDVPNHPNLGGLSQSFYATTKNSSASWIWIADFTDDPYSISILSHECVHAAHAALRDRGFNMNDDSSEAQAYLVGLLVRKCLEGWKK